MRYHKPLLSASELSCRILITKFVSLYVLLASCMFVQMAEELETMNFGNINLFVGFKASFVQVQRPQACGQLNCKFPIKMKVFLDVLHVAASNESVEVHHIEIQFSVGVIDTLTTCSAGTKTQPFPILANSLQVQLQRGHSVQSQQWSLIPGRCRRAPAFQILTELYPPLGFQNFTELIPFVFRSHA